MNEDNLTHWRPAKCPACGAWQMAQVTTTANRRDHHLVLNCGGCGGRYESRLGFDAAGRQDAPRRARHRFAGKGQRVVYFPPCDGLSERRPADEPRLFAGAVYTVAEVRVDRQTDAGWYRLEELPHLEFSAGMFAPLAELNDGGDAIPPPDETGGGDSLWRDGVEGTSYKVSPSGVALLSACGTVTIFLSKAVIEMCRGVMFQKGDRAK